MIETDPKLLGLFVVVSPTQTVVWYSSAGSSQDRKGGVNTSCKPTHMHCTCFHYLVVQSTTNCILDNVHSNIMILVFIIMFCSIHCCSSVYHNYYLSIGLTTGILRRKDLSFSVTTTSSLSSTISFLVRSKSSSLFPSHMSLSYCMESSNTPPLMSCTLG